MGRCRLDHGLEHGAIRRGGPEDEVGHDLIERRAGRLAAVPALERRIDRELHRLEHRHRHLRPPAAAHLLARESREERALEALDLHRQDHGIGLVGDEAGAVIDLHQAAGDGEAPLGEDDQRLAALDGVDKRPRRHRLCRIERHGAGDLQERAHPPALGDAVVDGEDRLLVEERQRQRRVEEAHMVERHDRVRAGLGDVLEPLHLEPIEGPEEDREEIAERARRQRPEDDQAGYDVGDAERRDDGRQRDAGLLQPGGDERARHHEGGREHVDGGDDAGAAIRPGPGLNRGEGRHDEQAAGDREPGEVDRDAQSVGSGEERPRADRRHRRRGMVDRVGEVEPEGAHEERPDRRRQQHDASAREP